jgi:hypothetical protein
MDGNSIISRVVAITAIFVAAPPLWAQSWFEEAAIETGVDSIFDPCPNYITGIALMVAGGACGDFNRDGWQDLYVISGGSNPDRLYINNGDGTFTDQAAAWGITDLHMGSGAAVGDINNDGWLDMFITSNGDATQSMANGNHRLYRNNGNGTFTNIAVSAGVATSDTVANAFGACFGDFDLDGDLDLHVTGWFDHGTGGNRLYRNNGDETFTDITAGSGLGNLGIRGFTSRFTDMNGDRYPELLLAGDFETAKYYINNGDGTFTDYTTESGTGLDCNAMGTTIGDLNNDGLIDWYVTNIYNFHNPKTPCGNMLYLNQGNHLYVENAAAAEVIHGWFGWGTVAVDMDHDGYLDLVEVNGFPSDDFNELWSNRPARMWFNDNDGTFTEAAEASNFISNTQGRGLINVDIDNDGDQDLVIFCAQWSNEPPMRTELFRNESVNTNHWLRLFLDTSSNPQLAPDGFGTFVEASVGTETYVRYLDGGSNYLSQSELAVHFGLGAATEVSTLRLVWANGQETILTDVPADQTMTIAAPFMVGDLNGDLVVDTSDLLFMLTEWGKCGSCTSDLNGDGLVGILDLLILLAAWA